MHRFKPSRLAGVRLDGHDPVRAAGEQDVARQDQLVGARGRRLPQRGLVLPIHRDQVCVGGQVEPLFGHDHLTGRERGEQVLGLLVKGDHLFGSRVDVPAGQQGIRPADVLAEGGFEQHPPVLAIERRRRHAAHGRVQRAGRGQHVALRRDAALRPFAGGVVLPDQRAVIGLDGIQKNAFGWKDACAEIRQAVVDQDAGAGRPQRDQLAVPQDAAVLGSRVKLPDLVALPSIQAVSPTVVRGHVDSARDQRRRQPHRPAGDLGPANRARVRVQAVDLMVRRRRKEHRIAFDRDLEHVIEMPPPQFENLLDRPGFRVAPGGLRSMPRLEDPSRRQRRSDRFVRHPAARHIVPKRGPIGAEHRAGQKQPQPRREPGQAQDCVAVQLALASQHSRQQADGHFLSPPREFCTSEP